MNAQEFCTNYFCRTLIENILPLAILGVCISIVLLLVAFLGKTSRAKVSPPKRASKPRPAAGLESSLAPAISFAKGLLRLLDRATRSKNLHFLILFALAFAFVFRELLTPSGHWSEEAWLAINGELARDFPSAPATHHTWYTSIFIYSIFSEILSPANLGMIINARIVTATLFSLAPIFLYIFATREKLLAGRSAFFASAFMYFLPLVSNYMTFGVWPELIVAFFVCMFLFTFSITKNPFLLGTIAGIGICSKLIFLYFLVPFLVFYGLWQGRLSLGKLARISAFSAVAVGIQTAFGKISWEGLFGIVNFSALRAYFLERLYTIVSGGYFLDAFDGYPYKGRFIPVYYILFGTVLLLNIATQWLHQSITSFSGQFFYWAPFPRANSRGFSSHGFLAFYAFLCQLPGLSQGT